jgi:phosphate transport system ATP-binding protein
MDSGEAIVEEQSTQKSIQVQALDFFYGKTQTLIDVHFEAYPREVVALIGPSGCGKSTFLKVLNRMHDLVPDTHIRGQVFIGEQDILHPKTDLAALRKRIGMVFQKSNPFPKSIYDNVAYGPRVHGIKNKAELDILVESSLRSAALWDEVKDRLKLNALDLSGGQQQRLCIARALAVEPEILLMDEPASTLDPHSTAKIEDLITELKLKYCIVIVTHNMQQAGRISDRTAFFFEGELVEFSQTQKIFTNPEKRQTENYITGRFG